MLKIATHNSATGETPYNLLSWLVIPFARTQSKTIIEQFECGCRVFDIRIKYKNNKLYSGHGLFTTKKSLSSILLELNTLAILNNSKIYVLLTYENRIIKENKLSLLIKTIKQYQQKYNNLNFGDVSIKYGKNKLFVDYSVIIKAKDTMVPTRQGFLPLNGKTWQTYLPIPWLWKKLYYNKPKFDENIYTFVDFL